MIVKHFTIATDIFRYTAAFTEPYIMSSMVSTTTITVDFKLAETGSVACLVLKNATVPTSVHKFWHALIIACLVNKDATIITFPMVFFTVSWTGVKAFIHDGILLVPKPNAALKQLYGRIPKASLVIRMAIIKIARDAQFGIAIT